MVCELLFSDFNPTGCDLQLLLATVVIDVINIYSSITSFLFSLFLSISFSLMCVCIWFHFLCCSGIICPKKKKKLG